MHIPAPFKIFVHAALATLTVFMAHALEQAATANDALKSESSRLILMLLGIFFCLSMLEWLFDKTVGWLEKREQKKPIRLGTAGYAEGSWVDIVADPGSAADLMGSFIRVQSSGDTGFSIDGSTFDSAGKQVGEFDGVGYKHPTDERTVFYAFNGYHYSEGIHSRKRDIGIGYYRFGDGSGDTAMTMNGAFYGEGSKLLRHVRGCRAKQDVAKGDPDAITKRSREVLNYLADVAPRAAGPDPLITPTGTP
jgi:hypothetical protein